MDKQQWKKISRIFDIALSLPYDRRTTYIKNLCADDTELQDEINKLIASVEKSDRMLDEHLKNNKVLLDELTAHLEPSGSHDSLEGSMVGRWKIGELLGHGGMGDVYKTERTRDGVHQQGALKIMRSGLNTPENIHRFRLEQQILAGLHHPHIAGLISGGVNQNGLPYLVMEYVEGLPITEYCDKHQLPFNERLYLFKTVCQTVRYAHKNLIIHRDLKPDNILVSDDGHVIILDFGIAKLIDPDLYELSAIETHWSIRIMSLAYASPEQLTGEGITTSTDIYSLGMLLYELLTGLHPFDIEKQPALAIEQIIKTEEPPAPSSRLTQLADAEYFAELAEDRSVQPAQLVKNLRGDLDAITLKALRKEPEARYNSVERLDEDIANYLHNRPVLAREKAVRYRMKKFMRRHRWGVSAAIIIIITFIGGFGTTLWQARVAAKERDNARLESEKSKAVAQYLTDLFVANDPSIAQGDTITVREVLERGLIRVQALQNQPVLQATLFSTTGQIYHNIGKLKKSENLYRRASEIWKKENSNKEYNLEWAQALFGLARTLVAQGRNKEAVPILRKVKKIELPKDVSNKFHLKALVFSFNNLHVLGKKGAADTVFATLNAMLANTTVTPDVETALLMIKLAENFGIRGILNQKVEYVHRGQTLAKRALVTFKEQLGTKHPIVGEALMRMTYLYDKEHSLQPNEQILIAADSVSRKALHIFQSVYSKPNVQTYLALLIRSRILKKMGRYDEAKKLLLEGLHMLDSSSINDSNRMIAIEELADIAFINGNYETALKRSKQVRTIWVQKHGNEYLLTLLVDLDIGKTLIEMKRYAAAETKLLATYKILVKARGRPDQFTRRAASKLVSLYEAWNKPKLAATWRIK